MRKTALFVMCMLLAQCLLASCSAGGKDGMDTTLSGDGPIQTMDTGDGTSADETPEETGKTAGTDTEVGETETAREDTVKDNSDKADTTKTETTKTETTKIETTKIETTKAETTKAETTKAETTKAEATEAETTKADTTEAVTEAPVILPAQNGTVFANSRTGIYNYCPSVMQSGDGTRYLYYCTNKDSYKVIDYIGFRIGTRDKSGNYTYGAETLVLSPSAGAWDSVHTCDPSVIAGKFRYKGETYNYLMAYLGCSTTNNQDNKVGLAVAKKPEGPFIKVGGKPFIDFKRDASLNVFQWGVGQPSLVSRDKGGKVWLFYTKGDKYGTDTFVEEWDLSDLDKPVCEKSALKLSKSGLKNLNGASDFINNADFAYDPTAKIFYASSDCHPNPSGEPDFISSDFRVTSFTGSFSTGLWKTVGQTGTSATGAARNHNTGIVRNEYGHLADDRVLCVYYTVSVTGSQSLWSYRLHEFYFDLTK